MNAGKDLPLLLLDALLESPERGESAWREWRGRANIDKLDATSFRLLPALAGRIEPWLDGDPQRDILTGICRRGWSQAQVHRRMLAGALAALRQAGVTGQAAGSVEWADRYWPAGAVRTIEALDIRVAPGDVVAAAGTLERAGWTVENRVPRDWFWLRFAPPVLLRDRSGLILRLHWRALPNSDVLLPELLGHEGAWEVRAEHDLLRVFGGEYGDGMDWRVDASIIARTGVDRDEIRQLVKWRVLAKTRAGQKIGIGERVLTLPLRIYRRLRAQAAR